MTDPAAAARQMAIGVGGERRDGTGCAAVSLDAASDVALLRLIGTRDGAALEALYDRHHRVAMGLAMRLLQNRQEAEDVVQEAFLTVWRRASTYHEERGSVRNWLLSIVHHGAVSQLRQHRPVQWPEAWGEPPLEPPDEAETDVLDQAMRRIEAQRVRAALLALPTEQRETLVLAYFGGLSCQQIAERTGVQLGTVKGRLRLALQKLRLTLQAGSLA